jgi:hypothetical protein
MALCELAKFHKSLRQLLISLLIGRCLHAIVCFAGLVASAAHSLPCNLRNMKALSGLLPVIALSALRFHCPTLTGKNLAGRHCTKHSTSAKSGFIQRTTAPILICASYGTGACRLLYHAP